MKTFDEVKQELRHRAQEYAQKFVEESHKHSAKTAYSDGIGDGYKTFVATISTRFQEGWKWNHKRIGVVCNDDGTFVKITMKGKRMTQSPRQPKTPVTLENCEVYANYPGIRGLHTNPVKEYSLVSSSSKSAGVITRGRSFTDDEYARAKELINGGMDFFEAANQVGAA